MEKRPSHFRKWLGHFEETTKPFWKVAKSFLKVTCPFRLFPAKGRPCRRRDAATPPLSHLAFLVISLLAFDAGKFGSSKDSVENVTTETPSAARKAADEDCALRRKPSLIHGVMGTSKGQLYQKSLFRQTQKSRNGAVSLHEKSRNGAISLYENSTRNTGRR